MSDYQLENRSLAYDKAYKFAIRVVKAYEYLTQEEKGYNSIYKDADEISAILYSILKKTRINTQHE